MQYYTFMLLQGEKVQLEVDPDAINTVAVSLEDGSTIYAVAGASEEKKLISLQKRIDEEKIIASLIQIRDEMAAAWCSGDGTTGNASRDESQRIPSPASPSLFNKNAEGSVTTLASASSAKPQWCYA